MSPPPCLVGVSPLVRRPPLPPPRLPRPGPELTSAREPEPRPPVAVTRTLFSVARSRPHPVPCLTL